MRDREQELITRKEAANLIAKRLPIDMLKPYDTDCFASMLSAVAYLKQRQAWVVVSAEHLEIISALVSWIEFDGEHNHDTMIVTGKQSVS